MEALHHRLRAMVAGADRDAVGIQYRAHVVRVHALDLERQHGGFFRGRADDPDTGQCRDLLVA